ncbi:hypothetical protein BDZ85DRAFT_264361, partial [Elsinoe ampelina]
MVMLVIVMLVIVMSKSSRPNRVKRNGSAQIARQVKQSCVRTQRKVPRASPPEDPACRHVGSGERRPRAERRYPGASLGDERRRGGGRDGRVHSSGSWCRRFDQTQQASSQVSSECQRRSGSRRRRSYQVGDRRGRNDRRKFERRDPGR